MSELVLDLKAELQEFAAIEAESIGWQPLGDRTYLHAGASEDKEAVIAVVGVSDASMAGMNVLLLT